MKKSDLELLQESLQKAIKDSFDISTMELYNRYKEKCNEYGTTILAFSMFIDLIRSFKAGNTKLSITDKSLIEIKKFKEDRANESLCKSTEDDNCPINNCLKKINCAHCTGLLEEKLSEQRKHKVDLEERRIHNIRKETLQKETEALAVNHDKDWTDEDLLFVIVNTHNHDKNELEVLYQVAIHLKRTLAAIEWAFIRIWEDENIQLFEDSIRILERIDSLKEKLGV